ncbi:uracil-DNA glycosylase family protein [Paracraurococcus lichenis]|uniref:Uracil-DNA glycosylase family protein n=1 Tax=Paracraurococcus lichenis TaxID=3064888 RepID=A0ABT9E891_9PROT|nr:uracil-DNA glycosylase family protein [Paracraurococcus sp. LOR1-02]MDO9712178.1 uracil-DNA glycosylase family protein [Paracraurococcus sp. LOR1-02]
MTAPLADPAVLAARRAALAAPHMAPLARFAAALRCTTGLAVPDADPADGGIGARLLLLLETPGPSMPTTGLVSRDNPTPTGANLRRFLAAIPRAEVLIWNAVPFLIHAPGARNRAPDAAEREAGLALLPPLLELLPHLAVAVLAGRFAARAAPALQAARPGLPVLRMPHPSPTYTCTSPAVPALIASVLAEAAALLPPCRDAAA